MTDFPSAWDVRPLAQIVDILDSRRIPVNAQERASRPGAVPYYGATGQVGWIDKPIFDEPLILLGEDGVQFFEPNKQKAYLIDGPAWVNNHAHVLRARAAVDRKFLNYYLNAADYQGLANGTTRLKLTQAAMKQMPVPLPALEEQRRIVDLLEDHLSRLDAADAYVRAGMLRASRWNGALIDDLLWREDYPQVEVRSLLREPMRNGRSDRAVAQGATGTRTLTITAVTKNAFTAENTKITTTTADRARGLWLEPGDVFVQRSNTPELVGTSARYDGQSGWAIFPDLLIRLRADETQIDSRFLAAALRSEKGHRQLRAKAKGAAGSMPKIDQAAIGSALVPLPPLAQQPEILAQLHEAANALARLRGELNAAARRSASLRRSLLAAAFSGRLTCESEVAGV